MGSVCSPTASTRRRAPWDSTNPRVLDTIEIRFASLPVIRVPDDLDQLVRFVLDELERSGADRMMPHFRWRDMAWIYRAKTGGEQRQKRGLGSLQVERRLVFAIGCHVIEVGPP